MTVERIICPVCGYRTLTGYGTDLWGVVGDVVIAHTVPGSHLVPCVASRLHPEDAAAVGAILAEGGERFRMAAHP